MSGTITGTGTIDSSGNYVLDPSVLLTIGTADATVEGVGTDANIQLSGLVGSVLTAATTYTIDVEAGATAMVTPPTNVLSLLTTIDLVADGGTVILGDGGSVISLLNGPIDGTIKAGGTLDLSAVPAANDSDVNATFVNKGGLLIIGGSTATNPSITGFGKVGDTINDTSVNFAKVTGYSITEGLTDETITFTGKGGLSATVTIQGEPLTPGTFKAATGPLTLFAAADGTLDFTVCFLTGTQIECDGGDVPVERLGVGDLVRIADGSLAPVRWIGHRTVRLAALRQPALVAPICIGAEAIAPGLPRRDLWVTPDHGIVVDGHLIPARLLVNGGSIRQVRVPEYTYYHVELDRHAILLAEGLDCESYLDTGNRSTFANNGVVSLANRPPENQAEAYAERGCMALTLDPAVTRIVWSRLADRSALIGRCAPVAATTRESSLYLRTVGGRCIQPVYDDAFRASFAIPAGLTEVTIQSRATMPWAVAPWMDDRRELGVAIGRMMLRTAQGVRDIALDSPALGDGWWAIEHADDLEFRWTAGAAVLSLPADAGPVTLEISLVDCGVHLADNEEAIPLALAG